MQRGPSDYNKIENEVCVRINAKEKKKEAIFIPASSFFFKEYLAEATTATKAVLCPLI